MPADDLARVGVGDQAQIDTGTCRGQIGDVGHPDLLAGLGGDLAFPGFEQVGMPAEVVMAVRGLVVGPARRHQQLGFTQPVKQGIPPQFDASRLQNRAQQMVQFARSQARLAQPPGAHQIQHLAGLFGPLLLALLAFVVRLATDADVAASPAHAQAFDELLREDLPKGFFTTRTP